MTLPRVVVGLPEWGLGGAHNYAAHLVRGLRRRGVEAGLFLTEEEESPLVRRTEARAPVPDDLPIDYLRTAPLDNWSDVWLGITRYLEERAPCIYIPNHNFRGSVVTAGLSDRVRVVGVLHNDAPYEYDHAARLGRFWNAAVAVNEAVRRRAIAAAPSIAARLVTIPIGVPLGSDPSLRSGTGPLKIVYHGRVRREQKRAVDLARVMLELDRRGVDAILTIIGDGDAREEIELVGRALIERGRLALLGTRPHDETLALLRTQDVFLLMSDAEGLPNAMLEAMAAGCVPVVSDIPTLVEVVRDGENGFTAAPGDAAGYASAIERMARDRELTSRLSARARATIQAEGYGLEQMLDRHVELFQRVEAAASAGRFRRTRATIPRPPREVAGVSILPGVFHSTLRATNRVPRWPNPSTALPRPTVATNGEQLRDTPIIVAITSGRISGVDVFAVNLVRELAARGYRAELVVTRPDDSVPERLPIPEDVPIGRLAVQRGTPWRARWRLMQRYLEDRAPCIYLPNYDWNHSCIAPRLDPRVRVVGIAHSDDPVHYDHLTRLADCWNGVVAVSRCIADHAVALAPGLASLMRTIPYGVAVPASIAARTGRAGRLRMAYAGRITRYQKRVFDLPSILDALCSRGVDAELTVIGNGPDVSEFLAASAAHAVSGRLRFVGGQPNERVMDVFDASDVVLLPSSFEGLPVSLLEAMGRGCVPVVSHVRSGVPELIRQGENGFTVPIGDIAGFAATLGRLAACPQELARLSMNAHRSIATGGYRASDMGDEYVALFEEVLQRKFPSRRGGVRPPLELQGLRSWFAPELPTLPAIAARVRRMLELARVGE